MKKLEKVVGAALLSVAMVMGLAACNQNAGPANELAGKRFTMSDDGDSYCVEFGDDSFILTSFESKSGRTGYYEDYVSKEVYTCTYVLNSEIGYMLTKEISQVISYERDGVTLYTKPATLPESLSEYKAELEKKYKALNPNLSGENLENLVNDDLPYILRNNPTENVYSTWKADSELNDIIAKSFYVSYAYTFDGTNLGLGDEDEELIPRGLRFGDIYNGRYEYFYKVPKDSNDPTFEIGVYISTLALRAPGIEIHPNNGSEKKVYVILSASNTNMRIVEVNNPDKIEYDAKYTYDEEDAFDCPISYVEGENKVTATISIDGTEYTFDIEYITKESAIEMVEDNHCTYTIN